MTSKDTKGGFRQKHDKPIFFSMFRVFFQQTLCNLYLLSIVGVFGAIVTPFLRNDVTVRFILKTKTKADHHRQ